MKSILVPKQKPCSNDGVQNKKYVIHINGDKGNNNGYILIRDCRRSKDYNTCVAQKRFEHHSLFTNDRKKTQQTYPYDLACYKLANNRRNKQTVE